MRIKSKKRLKKRGNYFHYRDYYINKAKYEYLCRKYGKDEVDSFYAENLSSIYMRNMSIEYLDNRGRYTDIQLYKGCYPSGLGTQSEYTCEVPDEVSVSFDFSETEQVIDSWAKCISVGDE